MKKLSFLFLLALLPMMASADAVEIDGVFYNLNAETMQATVTSGNIKYTGSVTIPATVNYNGVTYNVTTIGDYAFLSCTGMTSVEIPNSITSIGEYAFLCCSNLTSVIIPNSVTSIKEGIFCECSSLASVTIPNSVTSIGNGAFRKCSSLTSIDLPNSVTKIEGYAFQECSSLTSIIIPNSVTSIDEGAFGYCYKLASITIPNNVTSIGYGAFSGCYALTSVTIGSSVTEIGSYAFSSCSALTSIAIPKSVTSIGGNAFDYCSGLTSITVESGNTTYDSRDNCNAIIATSTNSLILGCKNTIIPNSVTSIGCGAFYGCSGLTSIVIPNSVMWLELWAFCSCSGLTSVTIGNSVQSIGHEAFRFCSNLTSVTCVATSVPSTYNNAFDDIPQSDATLYVPASALDSYKATVPWSGFGSIVPIGDEPVVEGIAINETNFPDENFRNWILSQEYGKDGVLTDEEIAEVTFIAIYEKNVQSLQGIEFFTALESLQCMRNQLTSLDVSKNTLLRVLGCEENKLTSLDLSKNTLLMILDCSYNKLTSLDVSNLTTLESLQCHDNQLTSLDVSNTAMVYIECYRNQLKGSAMETFVKGLPEITNGKEWDGLMYIVCNEDESNDMTTSQVAAAQAKGWKPYYYDGNKENWEPYDYIEPEPEFIRGDVNGDGTVNGTDIQEVINIIVNAE